MKKIILLLELILFTQLLGVAQTITQSAEGAGTVILEGSAISLDLAKTDLSFGWNNLNNTIVTTENGFLIGTSVKIKNSEGLGSLFSKGDLVPQGNGSLFVGGYLSNALKEKSKADSGFTARQTSLKTEAAQSLKVTFEAEIDQIAKDMIAESDKQAAALAAIKAEFNTYTDDDRLFFPIRLAPANTDVVVQAFRQKVKDRMLAVKKEVEKEFRALTKERFERLTNNDNTKGNNYWKFTYFLFGGIDATDFKRFDKIDSTTLSNSFKDEYFRGGNFGAGVNFEIWRFRLGLTYAYLASHNFSSLSSAEYTLQSSTVISNQTLQSKETVTAYKGKYGKVEINELNVDVIYNCKLDKKGENHLLINPYARATMFSRDTSLQINKLNFGIGGYFFKNSGKFLGGLYIELPDVNNNAEKKKPTQDQNLLPPLKRLSFGVVAKFSLKAIFNW